MCAVYTDVERSLSNQPSPDFSIGIFLICGVRLPFTWCCDSRLRWRW